MLKKNNKCTDMSKMWKTKLGLCQNKQQINWVCSCIPTSAALDEHDHQVQQNQFFVYLNSEVDSRQKISGIRVSTLNVQNLCAHIYFGRPIFKCKLKVYTYLMYCGRTYTYMECTNIFSCFCWSFLKFAGSVISFG